MTRTKKETWRHPQLSTTCGVKTTKTTIVKTTTTTTTTTTTEHIIDTPARRNIEKPQETETKLDQPKERERIAIRRKDQMNITERGKSVTMFGQIQLIQQWRKYQCIFVILSWIVNIAQNSITWYSNFTDAIENVQFVCDDFHSANYHINQTVIDPTRSACQKHFPQHMDCPKQIYCVG